MHAQPIIDPHTHLWDLKRHYYAWLQDDPLPDNPAGDIRALSGRDYGLDDYLLDSSEWNVVKTVHVECGLPLTDKVSETDWLQELAARRGYPHGIVAGAALEVASAAEILEAQAQRPNVRGIRQIMNWHADPQRTYSASDMLSDPTWLAGFSQLAKHGLSFDLQIYPSQMHAAARLAALNPDVSIILNHAGMATDRNEAGLGLWREGVQLLAQQPNVSVKISGFGMVDRAWTVESIRPFVLTLVELFGVSRCMFASNFPIDKIHGGFSAHFQAFAAITHDFSEAERNALFYETAARMYRL